MSGAPSPYRYKGRPSNDCGERLANGPGVLKEVALDMPASDHGT